MLIELRLVGIALAVGIAVVCVLRYRSGRMGKGTLGIALLSAAALALISAFPQVIFWLRDRVGLDGQPLAGLVVALGSAVAVLFVLLLVESARVDDNLRRMSRLVESIAYRDFVLPDPPPKADVAIVIPALNEQENLDRLLRRIPDRIGGLHVAAIVIDDGSTDGSASIARRDGALVISHPINVGGGAALRLGYRVAWDIGARVIVTMDADGQHDPSELERLVGPIAAGRADFVIGSRLKGSHQAESRIRQLGVYVFNGMISVLARRQVTDCSSGFRAFDASELRRVPLYEDQFHTSETILAAVKAGLRIEEVPITIAVRASGKSKKPGTVKYGWGFFRAIWKAWLR